LASTIDHGRIFNTRSTKAKRAQNVLCCTKSNFFTRQKCSVSKPCILMQPTLDAMPEIAQILSCLSLSTGSLTGSFLQEVEEVQNSTFHLPNQYPARSGASRAGIMQFVSPIATPSPPPPPPQHKGCRIAAQALTAACRRAMAVVILSTLLAEVIAGLAIPRGWYAAQPLPLLI
jgi:hypothetical protein